MGRKGRAQAGREHTDGTDAPERSRSAPSRRLRQARRGARPAVGLRLLRSSRSIPSTTSTGGYEPPEQIGTTGVSGPRATLDPRWVRPTRYVGRRILSFEVQYVSASTQDTKGSFAVNYALSPLSQKGHN